MVKILVLTVSIVFIASTSHAASFSSTMGKAGKYYKEGKYNEALESYDEALLMDPNDSIAQYNRAVVLYSKEDFAAAEEAFLNTLASGDERIEEFTVYNTGNSKYRESEKLEKSRPSPAIEGYKKTLEYYKRAMELSSGDMDAKYNYELTVKKIEEIEQQQQQQHDKKDQDQEKSEDKKEQDRQKTSDSRQQTEEEKKEQQQKEQEKQKQKEQEEKEKRKSKKDKDQEKKDQQDRQKTSDSRQQTEQEKQKQQQTPGDRQQDEQEMSKEEAEMLLRAQKEEENRMRLEQKKMKRKRRPVVLRDW